jgi:outer membrane protein OmpA-like peptidoglycan-associated protein
MGRPGLASLLVLLLPAGALADAVDISLNGKGLLGKSLPSLELTINDPIAGFELKLKRSDGKDLNLRGGGPPGVTRVVELQQPEGTFRYTGELVVKFRDHTTASMPLDFEAELYGTPKLSIEEKDLDLEGRRLVVRMNRAAGKVELQAVMDTGEVAFEGDVKFNGEPPGAPLELTWPKRSGNVVKLSVRGYDPSGYYTPGVDLFPWRVDIPHEEVEFDSGKWEIRPTEREKLDKTYAIIADTVRKVGKWAPLKLYVLGHTDSVGAHSSNRVLSHNRARSIGQYFKKRGVGIPVMYEGFGEEALLVPTPDETDEARNRRADYILTVEPPQLSNAPFKPKWKKL